MEPAIITNNKIAIFRHVQKLLAIADVSTPNANATKSIISLVN